MHATALIQSGGARKALGVDVQRDPPLAAAVELGERVSEQAQSDASATPGGTNAQRPDISGVGPAELVQKAQRNAGDLVVFDGEKPERGVVREDHGRKLQPGFVRSRHEAVVVRECLHLGPVDGGFVLAAPGGPKLQR